jgi:hypothetical protein
MAKLARDQQASILLELPRDIEGATVLAVQSEKIRGILPQTVSMRLVCPDGEIIRVGMGSSAAEIVSEVRSVIKTEDPLVRINRINSIDEAHALSLQFSRDLERPIRVFWDAVKLSVQPKTSLADFKEAFVNRLALRDLPCGYQVITGSLDTGANRGDYFSTALTAASMFQVKTIYAFSNYFSRENTGLVFPSDTGFNTRKVRAPQIWRELADLR